MTRRRWLGWLSPGLAAACAAAWGALTLGGAGLIVLARWLGIGPPQIVIPAVFAGFGVLGYVCFGLIVWPAGEPDLVVPQPDDTPKRPDRRPPVVRVDGTRPRPDISASVARAEALTGEHARDAAGRHHVPQPATTRGASS